MKKNVQIKKMNINMNRFRSSNFAINKQQAATSKTNVKTSSAAASSSSIANSFDSKCQIAKENLPISQQNVKKKRTALENISNANNGNSSTSSTSSSVSFNKDVAKKSRFGGGGNPAFGLNAYGNDAAVLKKPAESVVKKSSILLGSSKSIFCVVVIFFS